MSFELVALPGSERPAVESIVGTIIGAAPPEDVVEVTIRESREKTVTLLFDPEHNLEDRILNEQFAY